MHAWDCIQTPSSAVEGERVCKDAGQWSLLPRHPNAA